MSKFTGTFLDAEFAPSADPSDGLIELIPVGSLDAFDPYSDIFAPAVNIFSSEGSPIVAGATIDLLAGENWPALIASVDTGDLTETLNSPTLYTITDPKSGISVQFVGTGFTATTLNFGATYTILATGTVTGFNVKLDGVSIASGSGYSLSASTIQGYALQAIEESSALPLFNMWFSIPTTISGTAAVIKSSLSLLEPYVNIAAVDVTGGPLIVSVAKFDKYESVLDKVSGGFEVTDTVADVKAALIVSGSPLAADFANVSSLVLTDGSTSLLKLTTADDAAAANLLAKVSGDSIVAVKDTSGDWVTSGKGNGLTINDLAGVDTITGGGTSESFVFAANWGHAAIIDFDTHYKGVGHDFVTLAKSEFAQGDTTLMAHSKFSGGSTVVTVGTNQLTFTGLTTAEFDKAIAFNDFKFV